MFCLYLCLGAGATRIYCITNFFAGRFLLGSRKFRFYMFKLIAACAILALASLSARAETHLMMACASPGIDAGKPLALCSQLKWTRPQATTLVVSSTLDAPLWHAPQSQWRAWSSLAGTDRALICTEDIVPDQIFQAGVGPDPCPASAKQWVKVCDCLNAASSPAPPIPPVVEPIPPGLAMKWNPGHYMTLDSIRQTPEIRAAHYKQIEEIRSDPAIKGVKLFIYWGTVERSQGDYSAGFAIIDEYLKRLQASGNKRLILSVQDRIFGGYAPAQEADYLPQYIVKQWGKTQGANVLMLRVWQPAVMDRYIALVRALAARYNKHPNFEMLQAEETSVSVPAGRDGYTLIAYGAQLKRLLVEARKAWPNTQLRLSTNFFGSDAQMLDLMQFCNLLDIAVGGPDIIPTQTIQANRVFASHFKGKMIWVSEVQSPSLGGTKGAFSAEQIYKEGMKNSPAYFVWIRNMWSGGAAQKWDTGLLPYIRRIAGVTVATCPSNVEGCRTAYSYAAPAP